MFFVLLAFASGAINVLNKMINLQAKKVLGTANGTLINYLEATVISFVLVMLVGSTHSDLSFLSSVPPIFLLGGLFGLVSMVLSLAGMARSQISFSTIVVLVGQLGAGLVLDALLGTALHPMKAAGILLVLAGVFWDQRLTQK